MLISAEPAKARSIRRSIQKRFSLGNSIASEADNPIALHSVDDELLASIGSFVAETMVVTEDLTRATKEAIAALISKKNGYQTCTQAHSLVEIVANKVEARQTRRASKKNRRKCDEDSANTRSQIQHPSQHSQALEYANLLIVEIDRWRSQSNNMPSFSAMETPFGIDGKRFSELKDSTKAEITLVAILFMHFNRVVNAITGEEMSTATMKMPRSGARVVETKGAVKAVGRMISPSQNKKNKVYRKHDYTEHVFPRHEDSIKESHIKLPPGLKTVRLAGHRRANAVSRLLQWVARYESDLLLQGDLLDYDVLRIVDSATSHVQITLDSHEEALKRVKDTMRVTLESEMEADEPSEWNEALVAVLVAVVLKPRAVYQSKPWKVLVSQVGTSRARSIVVYWSLRTTLQEASFLFGCLGAEQAPVSDGGRAA